MNRYYYLMCLFVSLSFFQCCSYNEKEKGNDLQGVWMLKKIIFPTGYEVDYPNSRGYVRCKIYDADSSFYQVELLSVGNETIIVPLELERYTFIHDVTDTLLVENGRYMRHFCLTSDTTYTVFNNLEQEIWVKSNDMTENRKEEIRTIVKRNIETYEDDIKNFVFSTSERKLERKSRNLLFVIANLVLLAILLALYMRSVIKKNKVIKRELELIEEQNRLRPQPVIQAMRQVEQEFFSSDYYHALRGNIESGEVLKQEDLDELEQHLKPLYPNFSARLHSLYSMSVHEYQVCLLLKINISPSQIASALCREVSSISSTRSRLYSKVFGKKGSSKEWDAFIATL